MVDLRKPPPREKSRLTQPRVMRVALPSAPVASRARSRAAAAACSSGVVLLEFD